MRIRKRPPPTSAHLHVSSSAHAALFASSPPPPPCFSLAAPDHHHVHTITQLHKSNEKQTQNHKRGSSNRSRCGPRQRSSDKKLEGSKTGQFLGSCKLKWQPKQVLSVAFCGNLEQENNGFIILQTDIGRQEQPGKWVTVKSRESDEETRPVVEKSKVESQEKGLGSDHHMNFEDERGAKQASFLGDTVSVKHSQENDTRTAVNGLIGGHDEQFLGKNGKPWQPATAEARTSDCDDRVIHESLGLTKGKSGVDSRLKQRRRRTAKEQEVGKLEQSIDEEMQTAPMKTGKKKKKKKKLRYKSLHEIVEDHKRQISADDHLEEEGYTDHEQMNYMVEQQAIDHDLRQSGDSIVQELKNAGCDGKSTTTTSFDLCVLNTDPTEWRLDLF